MSTFNNTLTSRRRDLNPGHIKILEDIPEKFTFSEMQTRYPHKTKGYLSNLVSHARKERAIVRISKGYYYKDDERIQQIKEKQN